MTEAVRRVPASESVVEIGNTAYPVLLPDSTVGNGLRVMIASGVRSLRVASQRGSSDRPDSIHRFRVGLRRLRSMLSAFGKVLPDGERRALSQRLGSVARSYSRLREWDVFVSTTVRPMTEALPDEPALLELDKAARAARRQALPEAGSLRRQVDEVIAAVEAAPWLQHPVGAFEKEWDKDLKTFASDLLEKRHRRVCKHLKRVDITDQEDFHHLRVEAKKIRYPTEMFSNLFDPKAADDYLARLVAVQDVLGLLNDALVARDRVAELVLSSRAQGLVSGWLAHEVVARRARFPRAAKRLRQADPFWKD